MRDSSKMFLIVVLILVIGQSMTYAYDAEDAHPWINKQAAYQSGLDNTLIHQIGFSEGLKTIFQGREAVEWIRKGGTAEDGRHALDPRYLQHFHDPLKLWGDAGLKSLRESSLLWAQNCYHNQFSWNAARDYYHEALTTGSEASYAQTFLSLGQVMHLVADTSVPAHVRDDGHLGDTYESWAKEKVPITYSSIRIDSSIFSRAAYNPSAPVSISALWDQDSYTGTNPSDLSNSTVGLAEYTNANFFSDDTIFVDYPHPAIDDTNLLNIDWKHPEIIDAEDGRIDNRIYIWKLCGGEQSYRLASVGYLSYDCLQEGHIEYSPLVLDHIVHEDYAAKLIPRAVGYSAALLDYFFRGKIEVVSYLPIFWENSIHRVQVKIKNVTPTGEAMTNGTFSLVFRYTPVGGNPDGSDDIFVQAYNETCTSLPHGDEMELTFYMPWVPGDLIDTDVYDSVTCMLVFRGQLGTEQDAVIGKAFELGTLKFNEEWDNGLSGNNPWKHSVLNDEYGYAKNVVTGGMLIKDLVSYKEDNEWGINESWITFAGEGIPVTPDTCLQFRMRDMSINNPEFSRYDIWQEMLLAFNDDFFLILHDTGSKCEGDIFVRPNTGYFSFDLGYIIIANIYDMFAVAGLTIPEPLYLEDIVFRQVFFDHITNANEDIIQHMEVDFIRIVEEKKDQ